MGFGAAFLHVAISIFQYTLVLQVVNWYCWCCAYLWMGPQPHWLCASEETDDSQKRCEITLRNQTDITACQADSSCICASVSLNGGTSLWDQRNWMNCWNSLDPQAETERSESECVLQPTSLISHWKPCSWIIQLYTCHEADKLPSTEGFSPLEHVLIWGRRMFGACIPIIGVARCADDQASCSLKVFLCLLGCMLSSAFGNGRVNRKNALNLSYSSCSRCSCREPLQSERLIEAQKFCDFHLSVLVGPEIVTCNWPLNHWIQTGNDTSKASGAVKSTTVPHGEDEDSGMASYVVRMSQCAYYIYVFFSYSHYSCRFLHGEWESCKILAWNGRQSLRLLSVLARSSHFPQSSRQVAVLQQLMLQQGSFG